MFVSEVGHTIRFRLVLFARIHTDQNRVLQAVKTAFATNYKEARQLKRNKEDKAWEALCTLNRQKNRHRG